MQYSFCNITKFNENDCAYAIPKLNMQFLNSFILFMYDDIQFI